MVLCPLLLSGCWSKFELNERTFVSNIYIDKAANGKIELSLSFLLPNRLVPGEVGGASTSGKPYTLLTATGKSVTEAYKKIQATITRKISWGHIRTIVISEEMAKDGIEQILDFFIREPGLNLNKILMISQGKAKDIAQLAPVFERFPSEVIVYFAQRGISLKTTLKDFLEEGNGDMIVSILTKNQLKLFSEGEKKSLFVKDGEMALFHDYKMVGKLDTKIGRGAFWLRNQVKEAEITIQSPTDQKLISLIVTKANTKIRPSSNDPYTFDVNITADSAISETHSNLNLSNKKNITQLEVTAEKQIHDRINDALKASKEVKADAFQFGEYLSWHKPNIWKNSKTKWSDIYQKKAKINVLVDLKIRSYGAVNNPFWKKERNS